jgi:hypothetical protein
MGFLGYRKRTSFFAGTSLAQISEFSLIFMAMGMTLGHLVSTDLALIALVALITISISTYLIYHVEFLYGVFEKYLKLFERKVPVYQEEMENAEELPSQHEILVFGVGRYGTALMHRLKDRGISVMGYDFDPEVIKKSCASGLNLYYADIADPSLVDKINLRGVKWIVLAVQPVYHRGVLKEDERYSLILSLKRKRSFTGKIGVLSYKKSEVSVLQKIGADKVFLHYSDAVDKAVEVLL